MRVGSAFFTGLILALLAFPTPSVARSADLQNIEQTPHSAPEGTSLVGISRAIAAAAAEQGWYQVGEGPGWVLVKTEIRSHSAEVTILFDESNFQITYSDSENLDYRPEGAFVGGTYRHPRRVLWSETIHANYNIWVRGLAGHIALRTNQLSSIHAEERGRDCHLLVADEIKKLEELRSGGALTQDEFQTRKEKLLAQ
jgi:hypothetical protein